MNQKSKQKEKEMDALFGGRFASSSALEVDRDADVGAFWSKVCIVTRSDIDWFGIYILDLAEKSRVNFTATSPTIRINGKHFGVAAFCVLGSTLYAFEGFYNDWDTLTRRSKERGNKSAYKYELSSSEVSSGGLRLEKSMMHQILPSMHYPKYGSPIATPTPDGKNILLFSTLIEFDIPLLDKCDFELYDPTTGVWKELPGISRPSKDEDIIDRRSFFHGIQVYSFTFTEPFVLLIQTDIGLYSLDFLVGRRWERVTDFHGSGLVPHCGGHFVMIGSKLCLTPTHAYDISPDRDIGGGDGDGDDRFERSPFYYPGLTYFSRHDFSDITTSIALLPDDDLHFCILQTGIAGDSMRALLALDVYALDLSNKPRRLRNIARNLPGATIVKTFKFFVENQLPIDSFYPLFFHSIPPPTTL